MLKWHGKSDFKMEEIYIYVSVREGIYLSKTILQELCLMYCLRRKSPQYSDTCSSWFGDSLKMSCIKYLTIICQLFKVYPCAISI